MSEGPHKKTALEGLDETWAKFRVFLKEALEKSGIPEEHVTKATQIVSHDVLIFVPKIQSFLERHEKALENKDEAYFRLLAPKEFEDIEVSPEFVEKAFLYARVFRSLLALLDQE